MLDLLHHSFPRFSDGILLSPPPPPPPTPSAWADDPTELKTFLLTELKTFLPIPFHRVENFPSHRVENFPSHRVEHFPFHRVENFPFHRVENFPFHRVENFSVLWLVPLTVSVRKPDDSVKFKVQLSDCCAAELRRAQESPYVLGGHRRWSR